jgi:CRP/FNR family cyclic AMP-dependent transcriptional regulator
MTTRELGRNEVRDRLRAGRWFAELSPRFAEALLELGTVMRVSARQQLFFRGQSLDAVYAVLEGRLRACAIDEEGREALLTVVEAPNWVGEIPLFDGLPRTHDLIADVESLLFRLPADRLLEWLASNPAHWRELAVLLTHKLRLAFTAMEDGAVASLAARLARRLVWLADGYAQSSHGSRRTVAVSQAGLAEMLSTSRQSINRELRRLESEGLVVIGYSGLEVLDLERLRAFGRDGRREIAMRRSGN